MTPHALSDPPAVPDAARDLAAFLDASPTPYHAAQEAHARFEAAGFAALEAAEPWDLRTGGRYVVLHNGSSVAAFRVGARPPAEAGFRIVGAHTDSPGLRLKPRAGTAGSGHLLLDVEIYGGPILATWADRDLALAGRVAYEDAGGLATVTVRSPRAFARLSTLAIHLNRGVNDEGLKLDKHRHLAPAAGLLEAGEDPGKAVLGLLGELAGCGPGAVRGFDVALVDAAPAAFLGRAGEYLASGRLDDLGMAHAGMAALIRSAASSALPTETAVAFLVDHEEVGSQTAEGAMSAFARDLLARICEAFPAPGGLARASARSMCLSADMAHAVHPNAPEKHDGIHGPILGGGPVLKTNASRRYASDAETAAVFRAVCRRADVPCQDFVTRADLACGTTIGPLVAAGLGIRTADVGNPMLSMHSAREVAGAADVEPMIAVLAHFLRGEVALPW